MKKVLLLCLALLFIFPIGKAIPASFTHGNIWSEYKYLADTPEDSVHHMTVSSRVDTADYPVYLRNVPGASGDIQLNSLDGWNDIHPYEFSIYLYSTDGYPPPGSAWNEITYQFYIDEDENGYDTGDPTIDRIIPQDWFIETPMDIVDNVSISGGFDPNVDWTSADDADAYRVRVFSVDDGVPDTLDLMYDSGFIWDDGRSGTYSHIIMGDLFDSNETLSIGIEAWDFEYDEDDNNLGFSRRSRYLKNHTAPIPEPATMLLLGSGLIGLAGVRRKFKQ